MGGGIGLMSGASHRVVSERSKLAFRKSPSACSRCRWQLAGCRGCRPRAPVPGPDRCTAQPGRDIYAGLADVHVAEERRSAVFDALLQVAWSSDPAHNHERLTHLLQSHASDAATGPLLANAAQVQALCEGDDLQAIVASITGLQTDDAWLQAAQKTLLPVRRVRRGWPSSSASQRRPDLAAIYRLEYIVALHCAAHGDFAEGIRALLIDKDRNPQWNPATLAGATGAWADTSLLPWADAAHPLADLGTPLLKGALHEPHCIHRVGQHRPDGQPIWSRTATACACSIWFRPRSRPLLTPVPVLRRRHATPWPTPKW